MGFHRPQRTRPVEALTGQRLSGHGDVVYSVAFSPDGQTLATGSADKTAILLGLAQRDPPPCPAPNTHQRVCDFLPDRRTLATVSRGAGVLLWDLSDDNVPHRLGQPLPGGDNLSPPVVFFPRWAHASHRG